MSDAKREASRTAGWGHLPLSTKVPWSLGTLLALILGAMSLGAFIQVRRSAVAVASERLDRVTQQLAELLTAGWRQRLTTLQSFANSRVTRDYLETRGTRADSVALDSLRAYATRGGATLVAVRVWDPNGMPLLHAGAPRPPMDPDRTRQLLTLLSDSVRVAIGPFYASGDSVEYSIVAASLAGGEGGERADRVTGYVVERRRLTASAAGVRQLTELIGADARLLVGNRSGDIWTDLRIRVEGPPLPIVDEPATLRYTRLGVDVLARAVPLRASPWGLIVEFPAAPVIAPAKQFLVRSILISLLLGGVGSLAGSLLSRQITTPLRRLTEEAEAIAEGRPYVRVELTRQDEVGRLATSFNSMVDQVQQARHTLERLVERYRLLFDENPLPLFLFDAATLAILDVNAAAVRHYGYSREEFLAMSHKDIRPPEDVDRLLADVSKATEGLSDSGSWRHRVKDGTFIDVEMTWNVMELEGRRVVMALAHDVTARLVAERALRESEQELRRVNVELEHGVEDRTKELQASNQELEAFSYSVSHDLRAPLRAIDGFSKILQEDHGAEMSPEALRCLSVIARNARQMGQLIDDLLAFSRLGRQPLSMASVDMTALAQQVADEARRAESNRRGAVELLIHPLPETRGEQALLRQVLANYVQNAFKFSRARNPARIEVGCRVNNGEAVYFVSDNGAGFDMRYADKLFGVFQRLHRPEDFEGTGVGLAIVKRIVLRHGGRVWAEGEVDRGATFYFTLPRETRQA